MTLCTPLKYRYSGPPPLPTAPASPRVVVSIRILKVSGNTITEMSVDIVAGTEVVVTTYPAKMVGQAIFRDVLLSAEEALKILK